MTGLKEMRKLFGKLLVLMILLIGIAFVMSGDKKVAADAPGGPCPPNPAPCTKTCPPEAFCDWHGFRTSTGSCIYKPICTF
jgi:hypothetical protein